MFICSNKISSFLFHSRIHLSWCDQYRLLMMMSYAKKKKYRILTSIRSPNNYVWVKCWIYWKWRWFNDKSTWMYCGRVWLFFHIFCLFSLFIVGFDEWTGWLSKIGYESETAYAYDLYEGKEMKSKSKWPSKVLAKKYRTQIAYANMRRDKHNNSRIPPATTTKKLWNK